jgi:hypothetical protein
MAAPTPERLAPHAAEPHWNQTSFLVEEASAAQTMSGTHVVAEALGAVDHAADPHTRREALERLSAHLTQQALLRGRTPVPKRVIRERRHGG